MKNKIKIIPGCMKYILCGEDEEGVYEVKFELMTHKGVYELSNFDDKFFSLSSNDLIAIALHITQLNK